MLNFSDKIIFLDGAMGTMLASQSVPCATVPESINLSNPAAVRDVHRRYIEAGSDIIYTNTFGVNAIKLSGSGYDATELIAAGVTIAKEAANGRAAVAASFSPCGKLLAPIGTTTFDEVYESYAQAAKAAEMAGADLIVFETFSELLEIKAALLAAKETTNLPVFCTMSFEESGRTFAGVPVSAAAITLTALGADAIGINCSLGPAQILPLMTQMREYTNLPLIMKANAGLPDAQCGTYNVSPAEFASVCAKLPNIGVNIIGGCCGTTPEYIAALKEALRGKTFHARTHKPQTYFCSSQKTVAATAKVLIIGERINPTGKKEFKEALKNKDIGYIQKQAAEQTCDGADLLDINVGLPGIDEKEMMIQAVRAVQSVCTAPLVIDSSDPEVIEAALRICSGKALVNSVSGEKAKLETLLPIVKKYGAGIIGLTLDENGIPSSAQGRFEIAQRIVNAAGAFGIKKEDVVIDCLTLTVGTDTKQALITLGALALVKQKLHVKTILGVSNVSFGLPDRTAVNATFLTLALARGLDFAIINPSSEPMRAAYDTFNLLNDLDKNAESYLTKYTKQAAPEEKAEMSLSDAIFAGITGAAGDAAKKLLKTTPPAEIIEGGLVRALDRVGAAYEKGEIFLPRLLSCAAAAQAAAAEIKQHLINSRQDAQSRGKIVLATVYGDIHDIGKNIAKVILENYGYEIIDLGSNVPAQAIVDAVKSSGAKLVGLSALMTTTVANMAQAIILLRKECDCKILVGGAVLTEDYAKKIGADFYAKDALAGAEFARRVYE